MTMPRWLPLLVLVCVCHSRAQPTPVDAAVATVNGVAIPRSVLEAELALAIAPTTVVHAQRKARIAGNVLRRLIEEELIAQAAQRANIVVPKRDVDEGFREYRASFESGEAFTAHLAKGRVTVESIRKRIHERLALELLFRPRLVVSREEALDFYAKNDRFYTEKPAIHASHILFKLSDEPTADAHAAVDRRVKAAQAELAAGEDFNALAKRVTDDPTYDLGWFSEGRMIGEFDAVAFKLRVGEVSGPVRTRFGVHLIKLHGTRLERRKTFEEVESLINKSLENKKFFSERRQLLAELEAAATIEKFIPPEYVVVAEPDVDQPDAE